MERNSPSNVQFMPWENAVVCGPDEPFSVVSSPCVHFLALTSEGGVSVGEDPISWGWLYGLPGRTASQKQPQNSRPDQPAKPTPVRLPSLPIICCGACLGSAWPLSQVLVGPDQILNTGPKPESRRAERLGLALVTKGTPSG